MEESFHVGLVGLQLEKRIAGIDGEMENRLADIVVGSETVTVARQN